MTHQYIVANIAIPIEIFPNGTYESWNECLEVSFTVLDDPERIKGQSYDVRDASIKLHEMIRMIHSNLIPTKTVHETVQPSEDKLAIPWIDLESYSNKQKKQSLFNVSFKNRKYNNSSSRFSQKSRSGQMAAGHQQLTTEGVAFNN